MKYSPRYILFVAVSRYLSEEDIKRFKEELGAEYPKQDRKFLRILGKYFDFDRFQDDPFIWQDIWLYNYLHYEVKSKFPRKGLIEKYEKEIVIPSYKVLDEFRKLLGE